MLSRMMFCSPATGRALGCAALHARRRACLGVRAGLAHQFRIRPITCATSPHLAVRTFASSQPDADELARHLETANARDVTKHLSNDAKMRLMYALRAELIEYDPLADSVPTPQEINSAPAISKLQYFKLVVRTGAPFVVFGMIDNAIMIIAGETLDAAFGTTLGLSTMAAAAVGNMFSDVVGTGFGGMIQSMADKLRVPNPHLTAAQHHVPHVIAIKNISCVGGIAFGCLLGMFPLLFT